MKALFVSVFSVLVLLWLFGCGGDDTPTFENGGKTVKTIETGISDDGTTYFSKEYGFRICNLPTSGCSVCTRRYKDELEETVLLIAFTADDKWTFEEVKLLDEEARLEVESIPYVTVSVMGSLTWLPSKPDAAKEFMNMVIDIWEVFDIEVLSQKPVAGANTTGYEAVISFPMGYDVWMIKSAFFAKHETGYWIELWSPEDKYRGMLAYIDPMIAGFELLGAYGQQ